MNEKLNNELKNGITITNIDFMMQVLMKLNSIEGLLIKLLENKKEFKDEEGNSFSLDEYIQYLYKLAFSDE